MSFIASPPATLIDIDAAIAYNYVIAQQGARSITVDAATDFQLALLFGSPALLTLKFTGSPGAVPTYHTITIRLEVDEGSVTQDLAIRVLPTSATQRVPNITLPLPVGQTVAPEASVNTRAATDIAADSISAVNLPGTLSITSAGRITGTAPSVSGFYVVTLMATRGSFSFKRYFVFIVGTGLAPEPFNDLALPGTDQ